MTATRKTRINVWTPSGLLLLHGAEVTDEDIAKILANGYRVEVRHIERKGS